MVHLTRNRILPCPAAALVLVGLGLLPGDSLAQVQDTTRVQQEELGAQALVDTLLLPMPPAHFSARIPTLHQPLIPRGHVRLGFAPEFVHWDSRFGYRVEEGRIIRNVERLGFDLTQDQLGSGPIPHLAPLEQLLQSTLGNSAFRISLGTSQLTMQRSYVRIPVRMDVGVFDWLTVGGTIPFVKRRAEVGLGLYADTINANVGLSPVVVESDAVSAFLGQFQEALDAYGTVGTQEVLSDAQEFYQALAAAYGLSSLFPLESSYVGHAFSQRLQRIRDDFAAAGITTVPNTMPFAQAPLDHEAFQSFLTDPRYGVHGYPLQTWQSLWSMGDPEIHVAARVLESAGPDSTGALPYLQYRVGVGGLVRLGMGLQEDPSDFADLGGGDGQMDMEASVFGTVAIGSRFGGWARARYGIQREGSVTRRISAPHEFIPPVTAHTQVSWDPGNYLELELAPFVRLTPRFALSARYRLHSKGRDAYSLSVAPDPEAPALPPIELLNQETKATTHEVGFGLTLSGLAAAREGNAWFPFEAYAAFFGTMAGSGGQTPKVGRAQVGLRVFRRIWGG
jgi:hypothetical protein